MSDYSDDDENSISGSPGPASPAVSPSNEKEPVEPLDINNDSDAEDDDEEDSSPQPGKRKRAGSLDESDAPRPSKIHATGRVSSHQVGQIATEFELNERQTARLRRFAVEPPEVQAVLSQALIMTIGLGLKKVSHGVKENWEIPAALKKDCVKYAKALLLCPDNFAFKTGCKKIIMAAMTKDRVDGVGALDSDQQSKLLAFIGKKLTDQRNKMKKLFMTYLDTLYTDKGELRKKKKKKGNADGDDDDDDELPIRDAATLTAELVAGSDIPISAALVQRVALLRYYIRRCRKEKKLGDIWTEIDRSLCCKMYGKPNAKSLMKKCLERDRTRYGAESKEVAVVQSIGKGWYANLNVDSQCVARIEIVRARFAAKK